MDREQIVVSLSKLQTEVEGLKERNNHLHALVNNACKKVDQLKMWIMGVMAATILSLLAQLLT